MVHRQNNVRSTSRLCEMLTFGEEVGGPAFTSSMPLSDRSQKHPRLDFGAGFLLPIHYSAFSLRSTGLKVEFKQRESMFKSPILGVTGSSRDETRAIGWFLKVTDCSIAGKAHISKKTAKDESV